MGVIGLWQILSGVGEQHCLSEEEGTTVAVDLSTWIYQARKAGVQKKLSPHYFMMRTILFRTLELLRCGVNLVFVMDGVAPELKLKTLQKRHAAQEGKSPSMVSTDRQWFKEDLKKVVQMLRGLGVPVVQSPGEAEKMCAYLSSTQVVEAVLTDDGDAFLYGARKIYRNFRLEEKTLVSVSMADIEEALHLDRRKLIAFALLSGCDYSERGVKGIGPDHIMDLFKEMEQHCDDILDRICGWEDDEQLQKLHKLKDEVGNVTRATHCSQCDHTGTLTSHRSRGCDICETDSECKTDSGIVCNCTWHSIKEQVTPYSKELKAREKALEKENFMHHCKQITEEFTSTSSEKVTLSGKCLKSRQPDLKAVCEFLSQTLRMDKAKAVTKLVPVFAHMQMRKQFDWPEFRPISIEKSCSRNFVECYQTVWSKHADDIWTTDDSYTIDIEKKVFEDSYPELVTRYQQTSAKKPKCSAPHKQMSIKNMFTSPDCNRKRNKSQTGSEGSPMYVEGGVLGRNPNKCKKKLDFSPKNQTPRLDNGDQESDTSSASRKHCRVIKTHSDEDSHGSDVWEGPPHLKKQSSTGEMSEDRNHSDKSSSPVTQNLASSGDTNVHSVISEDLFPSEDEDDVLAQVVEESDNNSESVQDRSLCEDRNEHCVVMTIERNSNESTATGKSSDSDDSESDDTLPDTARLKPCLARIGLGDSDDSSLSENDVMLISSDESDSMPSLNSSNSSDVVLLQSEISRNRSETDVLAETSRKRKSSESVHALTEKEKKMKSTPIKKFKGTSVKKIKGASVTKNQKTPVKSSSVKKVKNTPLKRVRTVKKHLGSEQKSLHSYFPAKK